MPYPKPRYAPRPAFAARALKARNSVFALRA